MEQEISGFTEERGAGDTRVYRAGGSRKWQGLHSRGEKEISEFREQGGAGDIRV